MSGADVSVGSCRYLLNQQTLIEYVPNQHKITGKDLIVEEHGNRKPKKKQ